MTRTKSGRPRKGQARVQREDILRAALKILDLDGAKGLSMRSLADRLNINPMTLYHHVGGRTELLRAVSDLVYKDVAGQSKESSGSARDKIERLLISYYESVRKHPNLALSIFATPDAFSAETRRITDHLVELLRGAELSSRKARLWLSILVDFTHGSSLATAISCSNDHDAVRDKSHFDEYCRGLAELLNCLFQR